MHRLIRLAAAALLLAACGDAAARSGPVTLRFWAFGREGEVVEGLVRDFERQNPDIRVDVQQVPWTAAHEKLLTAHVGESSPDLAQLGNTWIPEFAALDALVPLDARVRASRAVAESSYFAGIWATNVLDGRLYGVPWYVDTRVVFYRRDLLQRAGYDRMPTTWDEWLVAMRKIVAQGGPNRFAILLPSNEWPPPILLGLQTKATLLRDGGQYGDFRSPAFRRAYDFYLQMFRERLAPPISRTQVSNLYQEFADGRFAMYITGPWNIGEFLHRLPADMQDKWMTAPMPSPVPGEPGASLAGGSSFSIFRSSKHPDAAWRLIEFLSAPEQQVRFYREMGDLPARIDAWRDTALSGNPYAQAFGEQLRHVAPTPQVPEWEQIASKFLEHSEAGIRGVATADQVLARTDADVDRILEKRRWLLAHKAPKASQ